MTQVSNASNTGNDLTVIIDTGCANLSSVRFAFERLNANVIVSADFDVIRSAARVVLPGVGTAGAAMDALKQKLNTTCYGRLFRHANAGIFV